MKSRIAEQFDAERISTSSVGAFVAIPLATIQSVYACCGDALRDAYRIAFERAVAVNQPSRWAHLYADSAN
jgi:hypothetical protein